MAKGRSTSQLKGDFKRWAHYRMFRAAELFVRGMGKVALDTGKLIVAIAVVMLVITAFPIILPYLLLGILICLLIYAAIVAVVALVMIKIEERKAIATYGKSPAVRDVEIMKDCQALVNDSANLDVVARRYDLLLDTLNALSVYSPDELERSGITLGKPIPLIKRGIVENKEIIFKQAVERSHAKEMQRINGLKTVKGKRNALARFQADTQKIIDKYGLPYSCTTHLETLCTNSARSI